MNFSERVLLCKNNLILMQQIPPSLNIMFMSCQHEIYLYLSQFMTIGVLFSLIYTE